MLNYIIDFIDVIFKVLIIAAIIAMVIIGMFGIGALLGLIL